MATNWENLNKLLIDLDYWIVKDKGNTKIDFTGTIRFDLKCCRLNVEDKQENIQEIEKILLKKCMPLLEDLRRKHGLQIEELSDIIAHTLWEYRVNVKTIESDGERKDRIINTQEYNKRFFDRISTEI